MGPRRFVRRIDVSSKAESTRPNLAFNLTVVPARTAGPPKVPRLKRRSYGASALLGELGGELYCECRAGPSDHRRLEEEVATHGPAQLPGDIQAEAAALVR